MSLAAARKALHAHADKEKAKGAQRFFKTGPGEYGEGDVFIGVTAPKLHRVAKAFRTLALPDLTALLQSKIHEERSLALNILVLQYGKADTAERQAIFDFYLSHTDRINNWDLVDCSASYIVGRHLEKSSRAPLHRLAKSKSLWERRIGIVSTHYLIRFGDFDDCLKIVALLLHDEHDLIEKACGWMLREVGKRDRRALETFLDKHHTQMPRVMLRYSLERLPPKVREKYMKAPSSRLKRAAK